MIELLWTWNLEGRARGGRDFHFHTTGSLIREKKLTIVTCRVSFKFDI